MVGNCRVEDQTRNLEIPRCAIAHLRFTLRVPRNDDQFLTPKICRASAGDAISRPARLAQAARASTS